MADKKGVYNFPFIFFLFSKINNFVYFIFTIMRKSKDLSTHLLESKMKMR